MIRLSISYNHKCLTQKLFYDKLEKRKENNTYAEKLKSHIKIYTEYVDDTLTTTLGDFIYCVYVQGDSIIRF